MLNQSHPKVLPSKVLPSKLPNIVLPSGEQIWVWCGLAVVSLLVRALQFWFVEAANLLGNVLIAVWGVFCLILAWDVCSVFINKGITASRSCSGVLPVNRWSQVSITLHHQYSRPTSIEVYDGLVEGLIGDHHPCRSLLLPEQSTHMSYKLKALRRGPFNLQRLFCRSTSRWQLWIKQQIIDLPQTIKVYPDFSAVAAFKLFAREQHTNALGIRKTRRRGEGADFAQLRTYRAGDALRSIHWKATSLHQQLISKEYQDAKDQRLVVVLDTGQRMRAQEETLSHFDAALNAALLVGFIALHQGDEFALQSFGPTERWIPLQKGTHRLQTVLNGIYDLDALPEASDYLRAAELINHKRLKRSLIIILTNVRSEDHQDLIQTVSSLKKKHLVLIADLSETQLHTAYNKPINNLEDALLYTALDQFEREHHACINTLKSQGILVASIAPSQLAATLANYYLAVKRAGVL